MKAKILIFREPMSIPGLRPAGVLQYRDIEIGFTQHGVTLPIGETDEALIPWSRIKAVVRERSAPGKKPE